MTTIGVDIGGTKIAAGVVGDGGELLAYRRVASPLGMAATLGAVEELIAGLRSSHPQIEAIGVGAAGLVEWPAGIIRFALNNGYEDVSMRSRLEAATGLRVVVDNDANAAAWGEARFGAGRSRDPVLMLTVGTGVGGGLVVGRRLYRGATGLGAEVGHLIVDPEGAVCGCGNRGCLEAMASGTALQRIGGGIPGESLLAAARAGDAHARSLFGEIGGWLGLGLASLVTLFDPEVIVIGGGLRPAIDLMGPALRKRLETYVFGRRYRTLPPIVPARLAEAGLVGAAALACRSS